MNVKGVCGFLALSTLGVGVLAGIPSVVNAADPDDVAAASRGFYEALTTLDDGSAMAEIWAQTPYVTFIGPRSKAPIVGWDAQATYWMNANKMFSKRDVTLSDQHLHVDGNLAWEVGTETADVELTDGSIRTTSNLVTNVYEKLGGHWLMVSHHAQPTPK
ncbi:MAG: nuclear transport factor 2 family protein [Rhodobacteraceae bacterium]|nr:nuclear transport factor 2 family protein [Paracoccaceae bacterium]